MNDKRAPVNNEEIDIIITPFTLDVSPFIKPISIANFALRTPGEF